METDQPFNIKNEEVKTSEVRSGRNISMGVNIK